MASPSYHFANITLLITHYNRSQSLQRLLAQLAALNGSFAEIVVSDDGSRPEHIQALLDLKKQYGLTLVTTPRNRGLGNNINKGQDAVSTPYTVYIQEDFVPQPAFLQQLSEAQAFMDKDQALDIVRFYAYYAYPYLKPYADGFSEMVCPRWGLNVTKIYVYSDHPHLRRSSFLRKFGRYAEDRSGDRTEYNMCISFIQNKGRGLFFRDFKTLLTQENDQIEPSMMQRNEWRQSNNPLVALSRYVYRQFRYNLDIQFMNTRTTN